MHLLLLCDIGAAANSEGGPQLSRPGPLSPEQLAEAHLPLVRAIARRYAGRGEELEDLIQLGSIGLVKASQRFDPRRGVAFASFATPAIEGEIRRQLRDRSSPVRIPRELGRMNQEVRQSGAELSGSLGRSPTLAELARALQLDEADVELALSVEHARDAISISPGESELDLSVDSETADGRDDHLLLARSIRALDERARRIVFLRFHADLTERQIARELGISQAHVSRLLARALEQLRQDLARDSTSVISPKWGIRAPKIPGMAGPGAGLTVDQYLELPYRIEVARESGNHGIAWRATVDELPGCVSQGNTPEEALTQLRSVMESWFTKAIAERREIPLPAGEAPAPRSSRGHNGRFLIRMPKTLHEQLAAAAERENVSLNRFLTERLAASLLEASSDSGHAPSPAGEPSSPAAATAPRTPAPRAFRFALATNLAVVLLAGLVAIVLLVVALEHGI